MRSCAVFPYPEEASKESRRSRAIFFLLQMIPFYHRFLSACLVFLHWHRKLHHRIKKQPFKLSAALQCSLLWADQPANSQSAVKTSGTAALLPGLIQPAWRVYIVEVGVYGKMDLGETIPWLCLLLHRQLLIAKPCNERLFLKMKHA